MRDHAIVTRDPLDSAALVDLVSDGRFGAVATFLGVVRTPNKGKEVLHIDYEGYDAMMESQMRAIAEELRESYGIGGVAIAHRLGRLRPGEASVAVVVSGRHRKETLAACQAGIDRVKERLPVWKYEVTDEGADWVSGTDAAGETI